MSISGARAQNNIGEVVLNAISAVLNKGGRSGLLYFMPSSWGTTPTAMLCTPIVVSQKQGGNQIHVREIYRQHRLTSWA